MGTNSIGEEMVWGQYDPDSPVLGIDSYLTMRFSSFT